MHEAQCHIKNSFITLTYDDDNLPDNATLVKKDLQLFFKKLRKTLDYKIRYYGCGEYGDDTKRPHYHVIFFNYYPTDAKPHTLGSKGDQLYKSETLNKIWGKGYCTFGAVTFESASYTSSYVTKKITGGMAISHYNGREPEFALMSRRPGIGREWYEKYKGETWSSNTIVQRNQEMAPPQYYKNLLKAENEELHTKLKEESRKKMTEVWFSEYGTIEDRDKKYAYHDNFQRLKKAFFKKRKI